MKKRIIAAFILVVFLVTGLFLSSNYRGAEAASSKQVLTYINGAEPRYLDPGLNNALDAANIIINVFEGLTRVNVKGQTVPGIAYKWTVSKDGLTYTFYLRDAKWSDGKPVTAYDFEYAWKRALDPKTGSEYAYQLYYIKNGQKFNEGKAKASDVGVKALNEKTLQVTLEAPTPYFLDLTNFPTYFPVRKDIIEKYGDKWATDPKTYIGNGPFKMTKWVHNSYIELVKNPNYWDAKSITLEKIVFKLSEDVNANLFAYEARQVDGAEGIPTNEIDRLKKSGELKTAPLLGTYYYLINCKKKPFNDPRVRRALSLAIDRQYIVDNIGKLNQKPATGFVPYNIKGINKDFRIENGNFLPTKADLATAKKLLAEAGYPNGKGFPEIEIIYNTSEGHKKIAEAIQNMWQKLGIKVKISNMEWKVLLQRRQNKDYMVARDGWVADYNDPMTFLDLFTSYSGNNNTNWSDKKYDSLIDLAKKTVDPKKRMQYLMEAEKMLMDQSVVIPIYFYTRGYLLRDYVKNYYMSPLGFNYFMYAKIEK
ncbi:extracellular solute-binding protein family 5 [Caldicellulosiruptor acetigenus I77R1B]|uniref:Extracellular solute-binding protein family 5 n=1 Tax=Caldicellulosiruptor acetigenus (strain ATCC 700853 / DSM 12137 / I77R1B) TaxID=632335 RepID=E4S411_CALA7|nr:peptide ABC transporter substrate-binding protein [Caldicellulosiruptor acetigenus]ADQ40310.1 extracellular solute-binding protein family 5 [Caldicellulosiruptor acetigenus I77R1B]